jgi:hypothetical protein
VSGIRQRFRAGVRDVASGSLFCVVVATGCSFAQSLFSVAAPREVSGHRLADLPPRPGE